jgi:hypothetical protein
MDVRNNNPVCASCELRFLCAGGCKANNLHAAGNYRAPDLYCSYIKNSIIDNIFFSSELGTDRTNSLAWGDKRTKMKITDLNRKSGKLTFPCCKPREKHSGTSYG